MCSHSMIALHEGLACVRVSGEVVCMYVAHDGTHSAGINHTLGDGSAAGCPARRASGSGKLQ